MDATYIVYKTWWSALLSTLHSCSNDTQYTPRFEIEFCVYLSVNNIWFSFCKSQTKGEMVWYTVYGAVQKLWFNEKMYICYIHLIFRWLLFALLELIRILNMFDKGAFVLDFYFFLKKNPFYNFDSICYRFFLKSFSNKKSFLTPKWNSFSKICFFLN
jgi:hypothetical protein